MAVLSRRNDKKKWGEVDEGEETNHHREQSQKLSGCHTYLWLFKMPRMNREVNLHDIEKANTCYLIYLNGYLCDFVLVTETLRCGEDTWKCQHNSLGIISRNRDSATV